ncbi:MAG: AAA family ATPase [Armatimonadetes bacterium]|nr:AAA family ATPase [Armatimonadota bacterium]NIM23403.1 AAA family ATPase [Armatimonadota bacterium]NIM67268.1 AAA family ATPase [Armatimonadota bacterium]NIM75766.1 AAA family ATPase [Armatimonadota bacterium]NIN05454.1 AAA family ATPase [Armatimonadota bacterium]
MVLADNDEALSLLGSRDENLRAIEKQFAARILARGNELQIKGPPEQVEQVSALLGELLRLVRRGHPISRAEVEYAARMVSQKGQPAAEAVFSEAVLVSDRGKPVRPRTRTQQQYVEAISKSDLILAIGPAGTGKTYLAMACAVAALRQKRVSRLILTRPAIEAGERLGFLPGDLQAKVDPYLRPLFDALYDMMDAQKVQRSMEMGVIEVAPLAFMRGRTLNDAFIILDEAQNTTKEQMKMFLTRLGFGSKAVVTGDITQTDLPSGQTSGLNHVRSILRGIPGITFTYFSDEDVVRHELVQAIIQAYEREGADQ